MAAPMNTCLFLRVDGSSRWLARAGRVRGLGAHAGGFHEVDRSQVSKQASPVFGAVMRGQDVPSPRGYSESEL